MTEHYHFIGIGGIGMSGLARLLIGQNIAVTGSDIAFNAAIEDLIRQGAVIYKGQGAENVPAHAKVVYTSDVKPDNPEFQAALNMRCTLLHRADLLAELLKEKKALAVAGTHGKTTTSALLATVLVEANMDPSFAVGGMLPAFRSNARLGKGEVFVFEADESDGSFLKYHPFGAIVTNIDNDHLTGYGGDIHLLKQAFGKFIQQVASPQHLFWCRDNPLLLDLQMAGQSYGVDPASDWRIVSMSQKGFNLQFDLEHQGKLYSQVELGLSGQHNVLNAAAVFGLAHTLGIEEKSIRQAFKNFKSVLRRCEHKGVCQEVLFIDDYAHHPTEIQTTLQGVRQAIGPRRLIAIFQPHRYSRTKDCLGHYGTIFNSADEVIVTDIYGAGEVPIAGVSHDRIQQEIQQYSTLPCKYVARTALGHFLSECVQPYDVVVTLGAGDITKLASETLALVEKKALRPLKIGWIWDHQTILKFKEKWHMLAIPYCTFYEFGITRQGNWLAQADLSQLIKEEGPATLNQERLPPALMQQLMECDVIISVLTSFRQATSLQGFLDIVGKPFVAKGIDLFSAHLVEEWSQQVQQEILLALRNHRQDSQQVFVCENERSYGC